MEHKKKRSPSKADRDPVIIKVKALRDSIADKEAAGEACKGLYKCYKGADKACLERIMKKLNELKAKEDAGDKKAAAKPKAGGGKARSRSRSRGRARSRSRGRK